MQLTRPHSRASHRVAPFRIDSRVTDGSFPRASSHPCSQRAPHCSSRLPSSTTIVWSGASVVQTAGYGEQVGVTSAGPPQPSSSEACGGTARPRRSTALRSQARQAQPERELASASGRLRTKAQCARARRPPRPRPPPRSSVSRRCTRVLRARGAAGLARRSLRARSARRSNGTHGGRACPPAAPLRALARSIGGGSAAERLASRNVVD